MKLAIDIQPRPQITVTGKKWQYSGKLYQVAAVAGIFGFLLGVIL